MFKALILQAQAIARQVVLPVAKPTEPLRGLEQLFAQRQLPSPLVYPT